MQQESPLPLGNFDADDPAELEWIYDLFESVNNFYSNVCEPSDPITCACGSDCHISDSRIRFEIQAVYEHQDDAYYNNTTGIFGAYAINEGIELNYFFMGYVDGTANGASVGLPNYTSMTANSYLYSYDIYDNYLNNIYATAAVSAHLSHELGHALGLLHTYEPTCCHESCDISSLDYLDDVFGSGVGSCVKVCWHDDDWSCDVYSASNTCTNNMMGGTGNACYFSPQQIGRMQRALHVSHFRKYVDDCPTTLQELVINEDETWDFDIRLYNETIRITSGNVLTIACKVYLPTDANIIVEQGAELVLDGGLISKSCDDLWQGIEVWGVGSGTSHPSVSAIYAATYPTSSSDHGVVYLKDGSTLEYARNAITTSKYDDFTNAAYRGGIIVAHGTSFINCKRSAEFMQYDFVPLGYQNIEDDNISEFFRCNFEVNDDYPCDETFNTHVTMWDTDGIMFMGNSFKDLRGACTNNGRGIYSINATYSVVSDLCGGVIPCDEYIGSFEGFYKGIEVENASYRPLDIVVGDITFTNNYRGILFSNVDNSMVINNTFNVPDIVGTNLNAYGIYYEDCTNYHVENNNFSTYGVYDESSPYNAGIYVVNNSNAVTEVYRNTFEDLEAGVRVQTDNSKLQIKCNTFNSVIEKHDIYVTNTGTLGNQGLCLSNIYPCATRVNSPTGNTFSFDCNNSEGDYKIYSGHPELKYKHHTETAYTPSCYTTGATYITLIGCHNHDLGGGCVACQSTLPVGGTGFRLDGSSVTASANDLYNELGKTQESIIDLEAALAVEENELEYNTNEPSENDDLTYLLNQREQLIDNCTNLYYLEGKVDSAILVLENFDIVGLDQKMVEYDFLSGNYESAESKLDNMNSGTIENSDFKVLYGILIDNAKAGLDILSLNEPDIEALESIAGKQSKSGVAAENLITFLTGIEYEEVFDADNEETEGRQVLNGNTEINIYPNPVSQELFIDISSLKEGSDYKIIVYDITGRKLFESMILGNATTSLNTTTIQKGFLFIQIKEDNQILVTEKIINE